MRVCAANRESKLDRLILRAILRTMLNETRRALQDFDNQHDFERMAADILNALGYPGVEPMAPAGGADGGRDIKFYDGDAPGVALVALEKKIRDKFKRDLAKQSDAEGIVALFCNVDVSPSMKLEFAREAIAKGYRLEVFDLERLRSLLDTGMKELRRRYLHIDDDVAARLRSEVTKLLRFPAASTQMSKPPTLLEGMLVNKLPGRLFDLLMEYEGKDVLDVPGTGPGLHEHLTKYYQSRESVLEMEETFMARIGQIVGVRFRAGWLIYFSKVRDLALRWTIESNSDCRWRLPQLQHHLDDAERVFGEFLNDSSLAEKASGLFGLHQQLVDGLGALLPDS